MKASYNKGTGTVDVTYAMPCSSTNHRIVYGSLASLPSYGWSGMACNVGTTGSASFDPGMDAAFFVIVANDGSFEGSYGTRSTGVERPEASGLGACDLPQSLGARCD